jgi:hypothetical protein
MEKMPELFSPAEASRAWGSEIEGTPAPAVRVLLLGSATAPVRDEQRQNRREVASGSGEEELDDQNARRGSSS